MEYKRFGATVYVRIDRGEELTAALRCVCEREGIRLAHIEALGACDCFTVGVYDVEKKEYHAHTFRGSFEIVSLHGTVTTMQGAYYAHLHMSAANAKGEVFGGHLNEAYISATCEMVLTVSDGCVERQNDPVIGLNLFRF